MRPVCGSTIIVTDLYAASRQEHVAIVTRVHNAEGYTDQRVSYLNATVLPDMRPPVPRCRIPFYETREAALGHLEHSPTDSVGFWPDAPNGEVVAKGRVRVQGTGGNPLSEDLNHGH